MDKPNLDSICLMPFISLGTKPDGVARLCCRAPSLEAKHNGEFVRWPGTTLEDTWNGETYRDVRKRMLAGEKLPECAVCWKEEASGKRSKRVKENYKFPHHFNRIRECQSDGRLDALPVHLDLRLGNTCNLRCRSCNPVFSSAIAAELRHRQGEWKDDPIMTSLHDGAFKRASRYVNWTDDPGFWSSINQLAASAEEIYISGGEPTLVPKLTEFLKTCIDNGHTNSLIRLNSNMTYLPDDMIAALSKFKRVKWGASIDAVGIRNDWLRFPSKFEEIEKNVNKLIEIGNPFEVEVNCTISMFNVASIPDLHAWAHNLGILLYLDFVHEPNFMQVEHLPSELKKELLTDILNFLDLKRLHTVEKHGFKYLLDCLNKPGNIESWKAAIHHAKILDRWQRTDISIACPEIAKFI